MSAAIALVRIVRRNGWISGLFVLLGAPLVAYSSDYVFDGRKTRPYVESAAPAPLAKR